MGWRTPWFRSANLGSSWPGAGRVSDWCAAIPTWRESLATLVIGTLSTGLGVAALAALGMRQPRLDPVYAACVGNWLGIGGIFWALRIQRGMSPLSVLGTALGLVVVGPLYLFAALLVLGIAVWGVVSVWGVRVVLRVLGG